jgi:hypothetical protein
LLSGVHAVDSRVVRGRHPHGFPHPRLALGTHPTPPGPARAPASRPPQPTFSRALRVRCGARSGARRRTGGESGIDNRGKRLQRIERPHGARRSACPKPGRVRRRSEPPATSSVGRASP